jgi:hypothetical protein
VKATAAHPPTDHTVTEESALMPPILCLRNPLALLKVAAVSLIAIGMVAFIATAPVQAASPWWHLETATRPTSIDPGTAESAVYELAISATSGTYAIVYQTGGSESSKTSPIAFNASAATVQAALASLPEIGAGNVEVSGGPGASAPLIIAFKGALADQPVGIAIAEQGIPGAPKEATLTTLNPGRADGQVYVVAENLGNADLDGAASPVQVKDVLPAGLEAVGISGNKPQKEGDFHQREPIACELADLTCSFGGSLAPYDALEVRIDVISQGAQAGELNEAAVSGGGAAADSLRRPIAISGEPSPFGVHEYAMALEEEGGAPTTRAGAHPFQFTTSISLDQGADVHPLSYSKPEVIPAGLGKDFNFNLPPGLIGNPSKLTKCTTAQFFTTVDGQENECPASSAVGVAVSTVHEPAFAGTATLTDPIFNMEPAYGEPARFGFDVVIANSPVLIDSSLRSERGPGGAAPDYGITATVRNITQTAAFLSSTATFWGVPGAAGHAAQRGWGCLYRARGVFDVPACLPAEEAHPPVVFSLPTSCASPLVTSVDYDSWEERTLRNFVGSFSPGEQLRFCNQVPFGPTIHSEPTSDAATTGTGLKFDLDFADEGLENSNPGATIESNIKKAVVSLPEGFTTNPSVAEGLKACSLGEYEATTVQPGTGCTEESKVGTVEIESPLVEGKKVLGGLYVARQKENPYRNLLTIYLIARNPELGVMVRQALKVVPDETTGQLTTEVDNIPQLPFSHLQLEFRSGQRSPLITPPACGTYAVKAELYPYSEPNTPIERESAFQITSGPEGLGCPSGGTPPFHPGLEAGTVNNAAGTYSPFYTHITRKDSEQEITHFSIKLPPGLSGKLVGVSQCPEADIAAAKAREHEGGGEEELEHPSCPASSEVGHTTVGTGVGNVLAYAPGKLYLAGPYKGSNLSIVSITAAKVGPFDLGTVVIREGLKVNPETAQVSVDAAGSDPIPHIVDGIPVHLRDIRIYVDRPNFTINPTSCAKMSTAATVLGSGLNFASEADDQPVTVTSPFQAADCASLAFKPQLGLKLLGQTRRGGLPKLVATVTYPKGGNYANIASTIVTLPDSELLEQGHIGTSCTRVQFNAGGGNGEQCPAKSIYGHARALTPLLEEPVEGPVYLRSNGGERQLPDLVAALHSKDIDVNLVGFIDSVHKKGSEKSSIRTRFLTVPDAPVSKFTLEMSGGKKGLLINSTNLCKGTHQAKSQFVGQNGKLLETEPAVQAQCGGKSRGKKAKGGKKK